MSIFDEFNRLQDTVNALMGDFGTRQGGRGRRRGGRQQGYWGGGFGDVSGWDDSLWGMDPMGMDVYSMPLLTAGTDLTGGQQGLGQGKLGDESKMDESGGSSTALSQQQGGGQLTQRGVGGLPVLRCRVNIEDQKDKYALTAEVPGFDKENLKVNIDDNNVITITGEQKKEHVEESKEKRYLRTERSFGRVMRSLQLPKNVNKDGINASYENGILHVNIPKKEEAQKPKQEVQIR